ncbi:hypothetical protein Tco_0255228 [Tanacetum coccineum]
MLCSAWLFYLFYKSLLFCDLGMCYAVSVQYLQSNPSPLYVLSSSQPLKGFVGLSVLTGKGVIRAGILFKHDIDTSIWPTCLLGDSGEDVLDKTVGNFIDGGPEETGVTDFVAVSQNFLGGGEPTGAISLGIFLAKSYLGGDGPYALCFCSCEVLFLLGILDRPENVSHDVGPKMHYGEEIALHFSTIKSKGRSQCGAIKLVSVSLSFMFGMLEMQSSETMNGDSSKEMGHGRDIFEKS